MANRNSTPDLSGILGRFSDALAFLRAVQRSLEQQEIASDEAASLRLATEALQASYNALDTALNRV